MSQNNKIISILLVGAIIGVFVSEYMYDRDFDGVPNDEDAFPNNSKEWKASKDVHKKSKFYHSK